MRLINSTKAAKSFSKYKHERSHPPHTQQYLPYAPAKTGEDIKLLAAHVEGSLSVAVRVFGGDEDLDELLEYDERETSVQYIIHYCVQILHLMKEDKCYVRRMERNNNIVSSSLSSLCFILLVYLYNFKII